MLCAVRVTTVGGGAWMVIHSRGDLFIDGTGDSPIRS